MLVTMRRRREAWLEGTTGSSSSIREEGSWKRLWNTEVPGKIKMFLWRLSKHSIPTEDVRAHKHMSNTSSCALCGGPDSWRHLLLECTVARCTWALADEETTNSIIAAAGPNAKSWLFSLMESLPHAEFIKISVTLWAGLHEGKQSMRASSKARKVCTLLFRDI